MRRWVARGDPAPALRRWLAQVSRALPPRRQRSEGTLAAVACALYALEGPAPRLLRLEDILMGCFLHWTDTGANPRWGWSTLQCVPQGLAVSGPALHEALGWRYGRAAPLWRSPHLHWRAHSSPRSPARRAGAAAPRPWIDVHQLRVLLVEGWDDEAEGSGGHWVGITHGGSIWCLLRGDRPLAPPRDPRAATAAVLASIPRVFAVWYAVLPAPGAPQPPPQHQYSRAGGDAHARAWLTVRELVAAWRRRRGVQVVFHAP